MKKFRSALIALCALAVLGVAPPADAAPNGARNRNNARRVNTTERAQRANQRPATNNRRAETQNSAELLRRGAARDHLNVLRTTLEGSGSRFFEREIEGKKRIIANVAGHAELEAIKKMSAKDSNVLQILHIGLPEVSHTMVIFDGELVHTQHVEGTGNWRLRNWDTTLRVSERKLYSAMISLSPDEARSMREHIVQARKDQGPEHTAGPDWANGKLKNTSLGGCRSIDCVSTWTEMPLGRDAKPLWKIIGLRSAWSAPKSLQKELETGGNERVFATVVYGPRAENFSGDTAKPVVEF